VIDLIGEAVGVKAGGLVSLVTREINVEALPMNVPEHIDVDVTALDVGDVLRLEDVRAIPDVTFLDDPQETVIATVSIPRGFQELEEAEAAAAAEAEAEALAEGEEPPEGEPEEAAAEEGEEPAPEESDEE
jgi:large subunit ribosomal protein L25